MQIVDIDCSHWPWTWSQLICFNIIAFSFLNVLNVFIVHVYEGWVRAMFCHCCVFDKFVFQILYLPLHLFYSSPSRDCINVRDGKQWCWQWSPQGKRIFSTFAGVLNTWHLSEPSNTATFTLTHLCNCKPEWKHNGICVSKGKYSTFCIFFSCSG